MGCGSSARKVAPYNGAGAMPIVPVGDNSGDCKPKTTFITDKLPELAPTEDTDAQVPSVSSTDVGSRSDTTAASQRRPSSVKELQLARVPPHVPELPLGYIARASSFDGAKQKLLQRAASKERGPSKGSGVDEAHIVTIHGMGGSGKTVIAAALLRDQEVRASFNKIAFVAVGQKPDIRQMRNSLYLQISGKPLDHSLEDDEAVLQAMGAATAGSDVLLCIDDAWDIAQVRSLSCLDLETASRILVTTRIQRLVPSAPEFPLALMEPDDAVMLMLEVAGVPAKPPFEKVAYDAAEACGHLPLVLSVAGSMLEQYGGCISERFLDVLKEDHGEVLREGDFGDEYVCIEDRIITASLKNYNGADREAVQSLLLHFAIFPEDARVPAAVFDTFACSLFGATGKRGDMKVRAWLTALLRLSLLQGSLENGLHQHDIIRDYCISRCNDLRGRHRCFIDAVLATRPPTGSWSRSGLCTHGTAEHFVALHIWWNVRGALNTGPEDEQVINQLVNGDPALQEAVVVGLGPAVLLQRADKAEQEGRQLDVARICFAVSMLGSIGRISQLEEKVLLDRVQAAAAAVDDVDANAIEWETLTRLQYLSFVLGGDNRMDYLTQRSDELLRRRQQREGESLASVLGEMASCAMSGVKALKVLAGPANGEGINPAEIEEGATCFITCIRKAIYATQFVPESDPDKKRAIVFTAAHFLGPTWPILAHEYCKSGILDEIGWPGFWFDMIRDYDFHRHGRLFRDNPTGLDHFLLLGEVLPTLVFCGRIGVAEAHMMKVAKVFEALGSDSSVSLTLDGEKPHAMLSHAALPMLGMRKAARHLLRALGLASWEQEALKKSAANLSVWLPALGGEENVLLIFKLIVFIVFGFDKVSRKDAVELVNKKEEIVAATDYHAYRRAHATNPMDYAARASEMVGDDALAEWYAARMLDDPAHKNMVHSSAHALRGRIASRQGNRVAAVGHFRAAARVAIQGRAPLMAWTAGRDCRGSEGEQLMDEACAEMGRPREEVLREFLEANAEEARDECSSSSMHLAGGSGPSVERLQSCTQMQEAVDDLIEIVSFDSTKEKHVFVPPASHMLAQPAVEQLKLVLEELVRLGGLGAAEQVVVENFLVDRVRPFLEIYIRKAQDPVNAAQMRELALRVRGRFRNIYLDTLQKTKDDDPQGDKAFSNMATTLLEHCRAIDARGMPRRQITNNIVRLFHHALRPHGLLRRFSEDIATASGGRVVEPHGARVPMKHFWRAIEKIAFSPNSQWEANQVVDIAREGLEFPNYSSMERAISAICTSDLVEIVRIKDRISAVERATILGWTDVMINLRFHADANEHICELQLFHETSMKCRSLLGGHADYVQYRTIAELFEVNQMEFLLSTPAN